VPEAFDREPQAGTCGACSQFAKRIGASASCFMTELARADMHPCIIQQRAGHSSLATTQRYIEVTPDQERKAVRAIRL
jgi:integrase